ncbi:DUF1702 family protein [Mangrovihabitans endophyticus]|nr:DUF1702 family protein [Mangrovihabitans endophyticus]
MARTTAVRPPGWRRLLVLSPATVDFGRRGFGTEPAATRRTLEAAAGAFLDGYHAQLGTDGAPDLSGIPPHRRGFAAEGAGMAAALLDGLRPAGVRRLPTLFAAHGDRYDYLIHVGVGWALAKLHRRGPASRDPGAPLLRWLAYDGMGFCRAFFAAEARLRRWAARHPRRCAAGCAIRHQGLGRSLWFRACGDPDRLAGHVAAAPVAHYGDLWSGIGLAAAYAAGVPDSAYERLREVAGAHRAELAQGAAFAAEAWLRSGHVPRHAGVAVPVLTGVPTGRAAAWTWQVRRDLDRPGADAADYQRWRLGVQRLAARAGARVTRS